MNKLSLEILKHARYRLGNLYKLIVPLVIRYLIGQVQQVSWLRKHKVKFNEKIRKEINSGRIKSEGRRNEREGSVFNKKKKCERIEVRIKERKICQESSLHFLETRKTKEKKCLIKRLNSTVR